MSIDKDGLASLLERLRADVTVHQITGNGGMRRVADLAAAIDAITSLTARAEAAEASLASAREDALEEAAKLIETGCDREGIITKHDKCLHGLFGWEDCVPCAVAAIRALKEVR